MPKIYLARHGQDEDNAEGILNGRRDCPLTTLGLEQSKRLAEKIKASEIQIDVIYTSPLKRAIQTAEILSQSLKAPKPIILEALIERDFGMMTGKRISEIESLCRSDILKTDHTVYFLSPKGAETFPELLERSKRLLDQLTFSLPHDSILLVTHGDMGKMIYAAFYDLSWEKILAEVHFNNTDLLILEA